MICYDTRVSKFSRRGLARGRMVHRKEGVRHGTKKKRNKEEKDAENALWYISGILGFTYGSNRYLGRIRKKQGYKLLQKF